MAERFLSAFAQNMNDNILYHALDSPSAPHGPNPPSGQALQREGPGEGGSESITEA